MLHNILKLFKWVSHVQPTQNYFPGSFSLDGLHFIPEQSPKITLLMVPLKVLYKGLKSVKSKQTRVPNSQEMTTVDLLSTFKRGRYNMKQSPVIFSVAKQCSTLRVLRGAHETSSDFLSFFPLQRMRNTGNSSVFF